MKDIRTLPSLIIWHGTVGLNGYKARKKLKHAQRLGNPKAASNLRVKLCTISR